MFSGIVEELAEVLLLDQRADPCRLVVKSALDHSATHIGHSLCVNGVCLTVVSLSEGTVTFDVSAETLRRSILGELTRGSRVNLERSLKFGERIHGHLVFGHVDGTAELLKRNMEKGSERLLFKASPEVLYYLAPKGSVSVSGVSLTVGEVETGEFSVYVIPHTLKITSLGSMKPGSRVNIEVDALARYVRKMLDSGKDADTGLKPETEIITPELLAEHGFTSRGRR